MVDRPVIFSAPMVRALIDGRKTMTRRLATKRFSIPIDPDAADEMRSQGWSVTPPDDAGCCMAWRYLPSPWQRVQPGDRLWVRESFGIGTRAFYRADADPAEVGLPMKWRPSIHMPRSASRLTLKVTAARVEPLNHIGMMDACAEGWPHGEDTPVGWFARLWNTLHGPDAWASNPEVVVVSFTVERRND